MWSANEFFYGSEHARRPDVYDVESPPRGPYRVPSTAHSSGHSEAYSSGHSDAYSSGHSEDHHQPSYQVPSTAYSRGHREDHHQRSYQLPSTAYSSGYPEDHHPRYGSPSYSGPRSGSPHGHHESSRTPAYAGATPLVGYHEHQPASLAPSPYQAAPYGAGPRDLHRPVSPYAEHGSAYAAPAYVAPGYATQVVPTTYYDSSHVQAPHSSTYAGPYESSYSASTAAQKSVELRVPLCCEACGERIRNGLFVLEGVRAVALDFELNKVTIVGEVNAAKALELVAAIAPVDATHRRPAGMQNIMYRNM